jgi:hypothetical protein
MLGSTTRLAALAARCAITVALAGAAGTAACEAIVSDSLPNLPCQPGGGQPSDTCPTGQMCGDAGFCVAALACVGEACAVDAGPDGLGSGGGEAASAPSSDGAVAVLDDGSGDDGGLGLGDGLGDDGGDDSSGDGDPCAVPGSLGLGCPCTDSDQCGPKSPHCMLDALDAGANDASDAALVAYCSHGCKVDTDCVPLQCSPITRACAP